MESASIGNNEFAFYSRCEQQEQVRDQGVGQLQDVKQWQQEQQEHEVGLHVYPENMQQTQQDSMCVRFIRKKYRCALMFLLAVTNLLQLANLLVQKIDNDLLQKLVYNATNNLFT